MGDKSHIEWTDATWNPVTGCTHVSAGCDHCYAANLASGRLSSTPAYRGLAEGGKFNGTIRLLPERLDQPLRWKRPRRIFVNSMSDVFHEKIPDEYIAKMWAVMALAPQHQFQVLTKRPGRMRSLLRSAKFWSQVTGTTNGFGFLDNVWVGVSAEDQHWADIRIPALLTTPAAVRFVSAEPLLGRINFGAQGPQMLDGLDWIIVGGESGTGARPMHPDWARSIRDQCIREGVPFLYKQQGSGDGGLKSRRILDGRTWDEYPEELVG